MALLRPYSKTPVPNTATILLVENEEEFQTKLADAIVQQAQSVSVNVRLACKLPLPVENSDTRPRVDLVVFIVNLLFERSLQAVESFLHHLSSDFFLGKVCFLITGARCGALAQDRFLSIRRLAASHHCPLICAEHKTEDGVHMAASRLLTILKMSAGASPIATTALYLSTLTRCTVPSEFAED